METETEKAPFWIVWNPATRYIGVKHPTQEKAEIEANILASFHTGDEFVVLRGICSFRYPSSIRTDYGDIGKSYSTL